MATTEKYTTVIELNSEQAKRQLDELKRKVESWKQLKDEAIKAKEGKSFVAQINRELKAAEKELKKYDNEVSRTINTLNNLGSASVERIEAAQKQLRRMASEVPHDSALYQQLNDQLDQVTQELENIKAIKAFERLQQEAAGTVKSFEQIRAESEFIRQTVNSIDTASLKQLKLAEQTAKEIKESAKQGTAEYNEAATSLDIIRTKLVEVETNEKKVVSLVEKYNLELKNTNKAEQQVVNETELINRTLSKLSSASVRDIEYSIKILNEQLRETERTGGDVEAITARLKLLNNELRKVQDMQKPDGKKDSIFSRLITGMNKNWGAITQIIGALTGLTATVRGCVKAFAGMEEKLANVRKYTGLADKTIRELNEDFKGMDTRTSREKLNQLAGDAGRLGLQTKEAVKEFVEGADMINVALGDDLGDEAVKNVGKLAMAFGEDERLGLRKAMIATGSAINELSQNSSAAAGYLVEYTARVAGFGKQLGLTQAQIMGYGAVMDENLLRDEMAATAFGNMLTKMQTDTEKFARIAGMSVENFTKLLNEDANDAILRLAENIRRQDPSTMMKMLDDMGLDGSRAVAVISTLADKVDDVRKHQELATKAYNEGTSVIKEYNTMNSTAQAELEKAKKAFHEITVEIGERLKPVVAYTISTGGMLVKVLAQLTDFTSRNAKSLLYLATVIGTYVAIQKVRAIWEARITLLTKAQTAVDAMANGLMKARAGLLGILKVAQLAYSQVLAETTGNMKRAAAANRALNAAVASNPWGAALTAIVAFVGGVTLLIDKVTELTDKAKRLNEVNKKVNEGLTEEKEHLDSLTGIIKSNVSTEDERRRALEELNGKLMEKHLGNLTEEAVRTGQATQTLERYLELKTRELKLLALEQEIVESQKSLDEANRALDDIHSFNLPGIWKAFKMEDMLYGGWGGTIIRNEMTKAAEKANVKRLREEMQAMLDGTPGTGGNIIRKPEKPNDSSLESYTSEEERKKANLERKKREAEERKQEIEEKRRLRERNNEIKAANDELLAMNMAMYAAGETNYSEYVEKQRQIQLVGIRKQMELFGEGSAEYKKLQLKEQQLLVRGTEEQQQLTLHDMERMHQDLMMQLEHDFNDAGSSIYQNELAFNEALFQENMEYLENKASLYNKGSRERMEIEEEIEDLLHRHQLENEQTFQEALQNIRENYLNQSNDQRLTADMTALEFLHAKGLLKEEEYQQALLAIREKYATDPTQQAKEGFNNKVSGAFSVARQQAGDANTNNAWTGDVTNLANQFAILKEMRANDQLNHAEYLAAQAMAIDEFLKNVREKYGAVFETIGNLYNAGSAYAKASSDYEVAVVTKKYDKQIEAAGKNEKKRKKLEEKKEKEIAAIKTKANERAMKMEIAQAIASTAMGAINAYTSAAEVPMIGYILAPMAAAAAVAAGMLQVATIKKQHQAEQAGYYSGGYTGGRQYRREAGVVHEGEFVANHEAVNNPNIQPFLNFLDQAQRNNTVGSLTAADVSRSVTGGVAVGAAPVITPVVNVQSDNTELRDVLEGVQDTQNRLVVILNEGIGVDIPIDGENGLYRRLRRYEQLLKNK